MTAFLCSKTCIHNTVGCASNWQDNRLRLAILVAAVHNTALQVIFLDSDNVAVADPSTLFDSAAYVAKGAVLWPDYWASSAAPDLQRILPSVTLPTNTFESGQMVLDKRR